MNSSQVCFSFFILCIAASAGQNCPARDPLAICTDNSCADTRICKKSGKTCECVEHCGWSCARIGCQTLENPENGNVVYDPEDRTIGSTATFSCVDGYSLNGNAQLLCREDKTWDGSTADVSCSWGCGLRQDDPGRQCMRTCNNATDCRRERPCVCDGDCGLSCIPTSEGYCDPSDIEVEHAYLTLDPETAVFGTVATITCSGGYIPTDGIQRNCMGGGIWSEGSLTCIPDDACIDPPDVANSIHDVEPYYINGERLSYSCDPGYTHASMSYLRCLDGTWSSDTEVRCRAVSCGRPDDINDGRVRETVFTFPNSVTYVCDAGFKIQPSGRDTIVCQSTQQWSRSPPSCIPIHCPSLSVPDNGSKRGSGTEYDDTVSFSCNAGFSLHGEHELTCQASETWSANAPECIAYCPKPQEFASFGNWIFNDSCLGPGDSQPMKCGLSYVCDEDYFGLDKDVIWYCARGIWMQDAGPMCQDSRCNTTDLPLVGVFHREERIPLIPTKMVEPMMKTGMILEVTCSENYEYYRGATYLVCKNGNWQPHHMRMTYCRHSPK